MGEQGLTVLRALLAAGAIDRQDLEMALGPDAARKVPTHREFVAHAEAACTPGSLRTYRTTFRRLVAAYGEEPVDAVSPTQLRTLALRVRHDAAAQGGGTGVGAEEGFIRGARRFYALVKANGHRSTNPAEEVPYSRRSARVRRALAGAELEQVYETVRSTSHDPALDLLLLDFHRDTACRQGGATALRIRDLNLQRGSVLLREKGSTERESPCARDIIIRITARWQDRTPDPDDDAAFRYVDGSPLTRRRYNTLFGKVHRQLPWAKRLGVSSHWLRHSTLTDVANATNARIASAYAGHAPNTTIEGYTHPGFADLVAAHDMVFPDFAIGDPLDAATAPDLARRATPSSPPAAEGPPHPEASSGTSL